MSESRRSESLGEEVRFRSPRFVQPWLDSAVGISHGLWQHDGMTTLTLDLQATLKELDSDSATKLERLVRDAIDLAKRSKAKPVEVDAKGWPVGYFEKFAGCMAGEQWDIPDDPPAEPTPEW
jgi:hypothetical protein